MSILPEGWWTTAVLLGVSFLLWLIFRVMAVYSYFEKRGIPYVKPIFLLGSDVRGALGKDCIGVTFDRIYKALKGEKVGGFFLGTVPIFMATDPEYVNKLLTTNFENFHDRPFQVDEETNPLEAHLFFLKGNKWKFLRSKLSPVFTSGKIKYMYEEMLKCSDILLECLDKVADGRDIDMHETFAKFATDVIGSTAFGLEPESLKNPDSKFRAMGKRFLAPTFKNAILFFLRFAAPRLLIAMKIRTTEVVATDYFLSLIANVFDYRRKNAVTRKDFVQLSLQLKDMGHIEVDTAELDNELNTTYNNEKSIEKFEITDDLLAAQSFVFYVAGFETTSATFHFLVYLLSLHPEIQDTARKEIRSVKEKFGTFSYESLKELTYLEKCICETLRLFPPLPFLNRECNKEFTLPDGSKIEKGDQVCIPIFSLQRDPKYFPKPEEFRPQRFEKPPLRGTYAPFGDGPRMCIGKRFAMVQIKMVMAKLLDRYRFEESPLTKKPIQFSTSVTLNVLNPLWVKISKCQD